MIKINGSRILILDLLDVLRRNSNKKHPLTQKSIIHILESQYGYKKLRRQTIQNNIERIIDHYGSNDRVIRLLAEENDFDETKRRITDIYYQHKLSDPELFLIIDSILFSKQIPVEERKKLVKKLEKFSSKHFNSRQGNVSSLAISDQNRKNEKGKNLFVNIKEIDKAIIASKKISFKYNNYMIRGNKIILEAKKSDQGKEREYIINPYYMAASNGRYYLICNTDSYDNSSLYRVDRMTNVEILDENRKPIRDVKGLGENFNLNNYMEENIYMFGGGSENVKLSLGKEFLDEFIDWFNLEDINVQEKQGDQIIVRVKSNRMAMRKWALRYALYVRVLSPQDLVDEIKGDIQGALDNYNL